MALTASGEDRQNQVRALIGALAAPHLDLYLNSAGFHAAVCTIAVSVVDYVGKLAVVSEAQRIAMAEEIARQLRAWVAISRDGKVIAPAGSDL